MDGEDGGGQFCIELGRVSNGFPTKASNGDEGAGLSPTKWSTIVS